MSPRLATQDPYAPPFFSLAPEHLTGFPGPRVVSSGEELLSQGEPSTHVFYLVHGLVKLMRSQAAGEVSIVGLRGSGWLLGAAAAMLGQPLVVTAITATPCAITSIRRQDFRAAIDGDSTFSRVVHDMHAREVYGQQVQLGDFGCRFAKERLLKLLYRLAPDRVGPGQEMQYKLPLKQWEIAQLVGVAPQYLCQLMGDLRVEGKLRRDGATIILPALPQRPAATRHCARDHQPPCCSGDHRTPSLREKNA